MKNRHKTAIWLEAVVCALTVVSGVCHYIRSGDWSWLLWVVIVICSSVRCVITVKANEKLEREAEMWQENWNRMRKVLTECTDSQTSEKLKAALGQTLDVMKGQV